MHETKRVLTKTRLGPIVGLADHNVVKFRGIRFAESPVGARRFAAPVRSGSWDGVYDATSFANRAIQPPQAHLFGPPGPGSPNEDCLFLNVYTPAADRGRRPVLCWIHGGTFRSGSGNDYDGSTLAAQGDVVVVTINYRLGVFGFLDVSPTNAAFAGSGGNGFRDQAAALGWIHENVIDFGGDPDNVTIFGESSGGGSVLGLISEPESRGLFRRAVAHSPGGVNIHATDQLTMILDRLEGTGSKLDQLQAIEPCQLLAIQQKTGFKAGSIDGVVVTRHPTVAILEQSDEIVPLVIGTNKNEGTLFSEILSAPPGRFETATASTTIEVTRGTDTTPYLAALRDLYPDDDSTTHNERVWGDLFRRTSVETAAAVAERGGRSWLYRFDIPTTVLDGRLGATHTSEIAFTFNRFASKKPEPIMHDRADASNKAVAEAWSNTIISFATSGDPNGAGLPDWPTYDTADRACLIVDWESRVEHDPDGAHRQLWNN